MTNSSLQAAISIAFYSKKNKFSSVQRNGETNLQKKTHIRNHAGGDKVPTISAVELHLPGCLVMPAIKQVLVQKNSVTALSTVTSGGHTR